MAAITERPELRGQPDRVIFDLAQREGRSIVTENVADYRPLALAEAQQGRLHAGLIFTTNRRFPRSDKRTAGRVVTLLAELLAQTKNEFETEYWL